MRSSWQVEDQVSSTLLDITWIFLYIIVRRLFFIEAVEQAGTKPGVISQRRFYEPVLRVKQAIQAGKIGRPVLATVTVMGWRDEAYYKLDAWRGKWATEERSIS